jgi:hypothetical protein
MFLKTSDDFEEVGGSRIAFWTEHLMKRLGMDADQPGQRGSWQIDTPLLRSAR